MFGYVDSVLSGYGWQYMTGTIFASLVAWINDERIHISWMMFPLTGVFIFILDNSLVTAAFDVNEQVRMHRLFRF